MFPLVARQGLGAIVNCTPFVRQYGILGNKWGALLCQTIFYKGIMPSEKVLDFPVDCNTLTGSVNL